MALLYEHPQAADIIMNCVNLEELKETQKKQESEVSKGGGVVELVNGNDKNKKDISSSHVFVCFNFS